MARYDDLDTKSIAVSAVISSVVLFLLIMAGRAMSYTWSSYTEEERTNTAKYTVSDQEIAAQKAVIAKGGKVQDPPEKEGDAPTERNLLPIDKAQSIIGKELGTQPKT